MVVGSSLAAFDVLWELLSLKPYLHPSSSNCKHTAPTALCVCRDLQRADQQRAGQLRSRLPRFEAGTKTGSILQDEGWGLRAQG